MLKIIYITDLHEANKQLRYLFQMTNADLYIVSGDLLYRAFYSYDLIYEYISLQEDFYQRNQGQTPFDQAEKILLDGSPVEWIGKAKRYLTFYYMAAKNMKEKYQILEDIFRKYCKVPVYVIPGNYDMDLDRTALQYRNLHKKTIIFHGYRISGFGGSDVRTLGIPEKLTVQYVEAKKNNHINSAYNFFSKQKSHILLIHKPIYGFFDRISSGNSGSHALVQLLEDKHKPGLILSGHIHEDRGFRKYENTILGNPGNFGRTLQPFGFSDGGFFAEIEIDANAPKNCERTCVKKVKWNVISRGHIQLLDEFVYEEKSVWDKFNLFEEIKFFFRQFETPDTKKRVQDFIQIARAIQRNGETIAFELLGSVNFGMSNQQSDVDLVMYHMCPLNWSCDLHKCHKSKHYQFLLLHTLLFELTQRHYPMEVVDCINLRMVLLAIDQNNSEDENLIRYYFYRRIGRAINKRFLHIVDRFIANNILLNKKLAKKMDTLINDISSTSMEKKSLDKYRSRLVEMGFTLPPTIREKIFDYLNQLNSH